ncbi:hypothetical protein Tco_0756852 [Tanacetum coccineum]
MGLKDGEDASKQGKNIADIDADEEITLVDKTVKNQRRINDADMFDVDMLAGEEVFAKKEGVEVSTAGAQVSTAEVEVTAAIKEVSAAKTVDAATITTEEITLAQALEALKTSKTQGERGCKMTEHEKPLKKKDQLKLDQEVALKLQAEFDEKERLAREREMKKNKKPTLF